MIRFAEQKDIPVILNLLSQVAKIHHQARPDLFKPDKTKYTVSQLEIILRAPDRAVFVCEKDGKVIGYCFCEHEEIYDSPLREDRRSLYIDDLCVDAAFRGHGAGSLLLEHVIEYAKEKCFDAITLNVWANNDNALAFYRGKGMTTQKQTLELLL